MLRHFLQLGYSVFLSDVDIVTLQNPFPFLMRDSDVEGMSDGFDNGTAYGACRGLCAGTPWPQALNPRVRAAQGIGDEADVESSSSGTVLTEEGYQPVFFDPRPLKNLLPIDEMESLAPIVDMKVRPPALPL